MNLYNAIHTDFFEKNVSMKVHLEKIQCMTCITTLCFLAIVDKVN